MFAYNIALASMGMGVWMVVTTDKINTPYAIIGFVVIGFLLLPPVTGLVHHLIHKRSGRPSAATYPHIWWGRAIFTLAIINGGLGLRLAWPYHTNTKTRVIVYSVVAGVIWLVWVAVIAIASIKSRGDKEGETTERIFTNT
jgi:Na+-transporting NADH:ubiquinone oxidoreductase subunit NqrE